MDKEILELKNILENDDLMLSISPEDIKCLGHFMCRGYWSWLFQYKGKYASLFDEGNGHYSFDKQVEHVETGKQYCVMIEVDNDGTFSYEDKEFGYTEILPCKFYFDDWDMAAAAIKRSYHSLVTTLRYNYDSDKKKADLIRAHEEVITKLCNNRKPFMMELEMNADYVVYGILNVAKVTLDNGSYILLTYAEEQYYKSMSKTEMA